MSTRRAFTLLEMLMAAALSAVGLSLVVLALVPTMRAAQRGTVQVALQQTGAQLLQALGRDLGRTAWPGLSLGGDRLALQRLDQVASDGRQVWEDRLTVYWSEAGKVGRKRARFSLLTTRVPCLLSPAQLQQVVGDPGEDSRWLAHDVVAFELLGRPASAAAARTVSVRVLLEARVAGRQDPERIEFNRILYLRNQTL